MVLVGVIMALASSSMAFVAVSSSNIILRTPLVKLGHILLSLYGAVLAYTLIVEPSTAVFASIFVYFVAVSFISLGFFLRNRR